MKKWSIVALLLAQNLSFVQAVEAAPMCLRVDPACTDSNLQNFRTLKPPGRPELVFPTDPVRIIYKQRGYRSIFFANNTLDRQRVQIAFNFVKAGAGAGTDLSANLSYLQGFLKSSSPNITLEYMLTYTVFKQLDEIQIKQTGKFFDNFKALAALFDRSEKEIVDTLNAAAKGKGALIKAKASEPVKPSEPTKPSNPPVKPSEPTKPSTPPVKPTEPTKPTTPPVKPMEPTKPTTPPSVPVKPPVSNVPVEPPPVVPQPIVDVVGESQSRYQIEPNSSQISEVVSGVAPERLVVGGQATEFTSELRGLLRAATAQGLNANDYWDLELERLYNQGRVIDVYRFHERLMSKLLRYAMHLSSGRVVGESIDPSFRFGAKEFKETKNLVRALNSGSSEVYRFFNGLEPKYNLYKQLKANLAKMRELKASGRGGYIDLTEKQLVLGSQDYKFGQLRQRLRDLGYAVDGTASVYDSSLESALKAYNTQNSLSSKVGALTLGKLNVGIDKRIQQLEVNLEKMRWLPALIEERHVFINLGFSEVKLYVGSRVQMSFRTVNGRLNEVDDKKTPSQSQLINHVLLNPTWTVPAGMAYKSKLPLIKKDSNWLDDNNFRVANGWSDEKVWDPITDRYVTKRMANYVNPNFVDWSAFTPNNRTPYWLVQQPGYNSTLGVLKFPLFEYGNPSKINPLDIYLHDTNERHLFANARRLESSGCIRLQYPVELAAELVQGYRGFDIEKMKEFMPESDQQEAKDDFHNMRVDLPKSVPVHMMYLTSDVGNNGEVRFIEDEQAYKLDVKVLAALKSAQ